MNQRILGKLTIDFIMTVLMLLAMASCITRSTIHELLGISIFILFIVHNNLNRRWYQTVLKGKYDVLRVLYTAVNLLLLVTMVVLFLSAVPISRTLFNFIPINNGEIVHQVHVLSAYWGFILMAVHLGMHWGMIINEVRKITGMTDTSRIRTIALRVFAGLIVVYGVQASFDRNVGSKLILYYTFDNWNFNESTTGFLINYHAIMRLFIDFLSIMGIYICGTYYALKFIQKRKKAKPFKVNLENLIQ